jgi:uncharacterized protein (DUF305 family)
VRIDLGKGQRIDVACNDREPFKACIDGIMTIIDKVMLMPAMRAEAPPPRKSEEPMPRMHGRADIAPATRDYLRSMHDVMREISQNDFSGDPSYDYAAIMAPYSRGAVAMAESLLRHDKADPQIRMIARKILQEQADNAAQLEDWLKTRQD